MAIIYEIKNLGGSKWCGKISEQSDQPDRIEAALINTSKKDLMSQCIELGGDENSWVYFGCVSSSGEYKEVVEKLTES